MVPLATPPTASASVVVAALLACLLLSSCIGTSEPANFYVIEALPTTSAGAVPTPLKLRLGPLALPALLDRPQIVTELEGNRVDLAEHHRWAEDLDDNLTRVLGQNLASRLAGVDVLVPSSGGLRPDLQIDIALLQFGGRLGKSARIEGVWRLIDLRAICRRDPPGGEQIALTTPFAIESAAGGPNYSDFVEALRQGIGRLSDQIAAGVLSANPGCER